LLLGGELMDSKEQVNMPTHGGFKIRDFYSLPTQKMHSMAGGGIGQKKNQFSLRLFQY